MKNNLIGKKQFTEKNQKDFANISCDHNPIHVNPLIARRLISGRCIVHGVNILLTGLNFLFKKKINFKFNKIKFILFNPVYIGEKVYFIKKIKNRNLVISIENNSTTFAEIIFEETKQGQIKEFYIKNRYLNNINTVKKYNKIEKFEGIKQNKKNYEINLNNFSFSKKYANTKNILNVNQFTTILSLSYFVGMICPGLNSILSSIEINFNNNEVKDKKIIFLVEKFYKGINLVKIKFLGNLHGEIKAFLHPGCVLQPAIKEIKKLVKPKEFIGINSLIIGGSRGLGELTAKILTSGKGNVNITYFNGRKEALELKKIIKFETGQNCEIEKIDILGDKFKNKIRRFSNYDFIFYYPTPKIFRKKEENFDNEIFKNFYKYYVKKFIFMCNLLEKKISKKLIVFFPSTIFIKETPRYLREYVEAKLLSERLIKKFNNKFSKIKVITIRLPKLKTDQTSEIITSFKNENIKIMVPIIRSIISKNL